MAGAFEEMDEAEVRSGSSELRRLAEQELRLADQTDLPMFVRSIGWRLSGGRKWRLPSRTNFAHSLWEM